MEKEEKIKNSTDEKISQMKVIFEEQRQLWLRKIRRLTKWMQIPEKLAMVEISTRNEIMQVSEEKAKLLEALVSITKIIKNKKAEKFLELKTESDLKLTNKDEFAILIDQSLSNYIERQELIELQVDYLDKTLKNMEQIGWVMKNRVDIMKLGIE